MNEIPAGRMQLAAVAPKPFAAMYRLQASIELDERLGDLIKLRASQLNGCAFCIDMHWKEARASGETEERLYSLDAWRESPVYNERERAALELCEAITLIRDGHVPDATWQRAAAAFSEAELAQVVFAITAINSWNRLMIASRKQPGHYEPRMAQAA